MSPVAKILSDNVIAHETAHQWWGDLLSWKSYRDQWLFEALANYSALLLLESESPAAVSRGHGEIPPGSSGQEQGGLSRWRTPVRSPSAPGSTVLIFPRDMRPSAMVAEPGYFTCCDPCCVMPNAEEQRAFRQPLDAQADAPFLRALGRVRERFQEQSDQYPRFLQVFEEELPPSLRYEGRKSLDWFYEGWMNGTAIPHLELQSVKYRKARGHGGDRHDRAEDAPKELVTAFRSTPCLRERTFCWARYSPTVRKPAFACPRRPAPERSYSIPIRPCSRDPISLCPAQNPAFPKRADLSRTNSRLLQRGLASHFSPRHSPPITRLLLMRDQPKMEIEVHGASEHRRSNVGST